MKILKYKYNPNKKGVFRISIVKNPAVGEGDLVLMSAQEIKGVFYAPVMIPGIKIPRIDERTGEKYSVYYDAETVEQLANNYFKQCGNRETNLDHEDNNTEGVYPVESWIVKDPESDKSKALGMPLQKEGTWIMGYKSDNPEVLEKIKNNLLQGLSIEGHLDTEEEVNVKFNKQSTMFEKIKEGLGNLLTLMSAEEEKPEEKKAEEVAVEEPAKMEEETKTEDAPADESGKPSEIETLKAEIEEKDKKIAELEAELATYKNDATLMSAQLEEVKEKFESYKAVKMASQKLGDQPREAVVLTPIEEKHAKFLKDAEAKLN